jgi:Domain of unknown function (DUF4920)
MKKLLLPLIVIAAFTYACGSDATHESTDSSKKDSTAVAQFGETIQEDGAIPASELMSKLSGKDSLPIKLTGTIMEVCQKKGCWMYMDLGGDESMRVTFKDYGFFVPKDASGKTAIIDGYAKVDSTSVAELRHYAEDGGASKDSIAKITEPEVEIVFEARGVIIKK